jgi:peptidyl-prolyl isomerase E (cyclophilin E)
VGRVLKFRSTFYQNNKNLSITAGKEEEEEEGESECRNFDRNNMAAQQQVQKNTLYVGGLAEEVNEAILHATFIPFGDIKDVKTPLDQATQKHRSFGFVTFLEREDAASAMDNMDGAELYGRVLTVNYALPEKIKGGEQGWAAQPSKYFSFIFVLNPNS